MTERDIKNALITNGDKALVCKKKNVIKCSTKMNENSLYVKTHFYVVNLLGR